MLVVRYSTGPGEDSCRTSGHVMCTGGFSRATDRVQWYHGGAAARKLWKREIGTVLYRVARQLIPLPHLVVRLVRRSILYAWVLE